MIPIPNIFTRRGTTSRQKKELKKRHRPDDLSFLVSPSMPADLKREQILKGSLSDLKPPDRVFELRGNFNQAIPEEPSDSDRKKL